MESQYDINFNQAQCLKEQNNIGSTVHHNVCNGVKQVVPWGTSDWLFAILMAGMLVGIAGLFWRMFRVEVSL